MSKMFKEFSIFKAYLALVMLGVAAVISLTLLDYAKNYAVVSYFFPTDVEETYNWSISEDQGYRIKGIHEDWKEYNNMFREGRQ